MDSLLEQMFHPFNTSSRLTTSGWTGEEDLCIQRSAGYLSLCAIGFCHAPRLAEAGRFVNGQRNLFLPGSVSQ